MNNRLFSCFVFAIVFVSAQGCGHSHEPGSNVKFYGTDNREAAIGFTSYVDFSIPKEDQDASVIDLSEKYEAELDEAITIQLAHLVGAISSPHKPINYSKMPGAPLRSPLLKKIDAPEKTENGKLRVHYAYDDTVVFQKSMFKDSDEKEIEFYLPLEPGPHGLSFFQKGCPEPRKVPDFCWKVNLTKKNLNATAELRREFDQCTELRDCAEKRRNHCTDPDNNSVDYFWYSWDPFPADGKCTLTADDLVDIKTTIKLLPSTEETYPDYARLYGKGLSEHKILKITFLVGIDQNFRQADLGATGFKNAYDLLTRGKEILNDEASSSLLSKGEKNLLKTEKDVVFTHAPGSESDKPRHKVLRWTGDRYEVLLNMYLMDPDDTSWDDLIVKTMRESDIFVYAGHSGVGEYFNTHEMFDGRRFDLIRDKYQIFSFNGCSTFSFNNEEFLKLKNPGDLNVVTNSIGAMFLDGPGNDVWLIRNLVSGERPSWQKIIDDIYSAAPGETSALTNVNGDENNPGRPD